MCRIVVAADSPILAGLIELHLKEQGYEVSLNHCDEVLQQVVDNNNPPDLVILDMTLPNQSELCARACEHRGIPMIILAAPGMSEHRVKTGPLHFRWVLLKPFSLETLLRMIHTALDSQQSASVA